MKNIQAGPVRRLFMVGLVVFTLLAAGCGGDDSGDDASPAPDDGDDTTETTEAPAEPVEGGALVYGIEAESDGWNPTVNSWAISGLLIAQSVYDSLAAYDQEGIARPYLAESFDHNDDYTEWTINLPSGVRFHNGDPLTADAVKVMLDGHLASGLSAPAFEPVAGVEAVDELTVRVTMNAPWAAFPTALTGQTGVVPHPSIIQGGNTDAPIGTGPFTFGEWVPDRHWIGEKNEDYWRDGLPYLDEIEFVPLNDPLTRIEALKAGDVDVIHTSGEVDVDSVQEQLDAGDMRVWTDEGENEEGSLMMNMSAPPFDDERMRRAVAYATDQEDYNTVVGRGSSATVTGPFTPTNPFYVETDYPTYDLDKAKELVAELKAEGKSVAFELLNTPNAFDREQSAYLKEMYEAAGFQVQLEFAEFAQFVALAAVGDYQAMAWRQFSSPDPDGEYQWWHSGSSLNFARLADSEVDAALESGRQNAGHDSRQQSYVDLQNRMAEAVPYAWFNHIEWFIIADSSVNDIPNGPLPDGDVSLLFQAGVHRTAQIWRE